MYIPVLCLLLLSAIPVLGHNDPPEVKLALSYEVFDGIKTSYIKPIIENKLQNLTLNNTFSIKKGHLELDISNITFTDVQIDWETSGLVVSEDRQHPSILLHIATLSFKFDSKSNFLVLELQGKNNEASVQDLNIQIDLLAEYSLDGNACLCINSTEVSIQKVDIKMSKSVPHILLLLAKAFGAKFEVIAANAIQEQIIGMNQTLINLSSEIHEFTVLDLFAVNVSLAELPFIFNVQHQAYQAISLNIATKNIKTNQLAPVAAVDQMPDFVDGDLPIQIILSESILEQVLWGAFQIETKFVLSQGNVPKDFPLILSTSGLTVLFRDFVAQYGREKGVYINVEKGGDYPRIFIRDGRISGTVALNVGFLVDVDTHDYPQQGLDKCVEAGHCELAVGLNVTAFFSAVVYRKNSTTLGVKIMNVQLVDAEVTGGTLDGSGAKSLLNGLLVGLLAQINFQLGAGIPNPLIGLFGLNDTSLKVGADYLLLGMSFDFIQQFETLEY